MPSDGRFMNDWINDCCGGLPNDIGGRAEERAVALAAIRARKNYGSLR
jgi:hypothetical protein